ncbi:MAG: hypothetical protein CL897_02085 [Dehalococcoidia bacterium]|nr:hypothetical protein [Dehalococcoidia bacterium]HCV00783.1 hypothetical protein [Dehalococcoidia bacterium]|tara:strand:- start:99 stop:899 length:801 start_codon:yes stop_codon:yes gene_type:complete
MTVLEGTAAIITGAANGIGKGIARALANEGVALALCDIDPSVNELATELEAVGVAVTASEADVSNADEIKRFVDGAINRFERIHTMVSNAGTWRSTYPLDPWEKAIDDFDAVIATNLKGVFLSGRAIAPHMAQMGGGHIVNIATDHICPPPGYSTGGGTNMDIYDASKWGINGFTQAWARVLASDGIRVNALCMDATDSKMIRTALGRTPPPELLEAWMRPEQIAALLIDLLKEGDDGRTGENIGIWLDHEIALPPKAEPLPSRFQ